MADPNRSIRKKALQNGTFLEVLIKALGDAVERHDNESSENHDDDDDDNEKMRRYASTLLMLQNAKPKVKRMVIQKAGKELMNCLCECGRNILKGTVPISKAQLRDLKRYEKHLRCIDKKSVPIEEEETNITKRWISRDFSQTVGWNAIGSDKMKKNASDRFIS